MSITLKILRKCRSTGYRDEQIICFRAYQNVDPLAIIIDKEGRRAEGAKSLIMLSQILKIKNVDRVLATFKIDSVFRKFLLLQACR